jgi:hypothetical protein
MKNKGMNQYIVFQKSVNGNIVDIEPIIPLMIGSYWCATYNMNPLQLHQAGENAISFRGCFIIEGVIKYFLAHEKIAHNTLDTVLDDNGKTYTTTLKTQDSLNHSVVTSVGKGKEKAE